jgi:hypothetical protein
VERIGIAVVSNIPTSRFKESEGKLRHLHLVDQTRGHGFVGELSSLEVGTGSTRRSGVFHVGTLESRAAEVLSESASKRLNVEDSGTDTSESGRSDVPSEGLSTASEPARV